MEQNIKGEIIMSFNKCILQGRLTAIPELKQTTIGTHITSFTLAVDRKFVKEGEEKKADFITIVGWNQTAEFICKHFKKGDPILVCGELQTRTWKDSQGNNRYATEVVASEVSFCGSKNENSTNNTSQQQNAVQSGFGASTAFAPKFDEVSLDSDLPF